MAFDFSVEPEFQEKLDWIKQFVEEEIYPLETLDLDTPSLREAIKPLQEEVKRKGLWAAHLDPELGGQGFGQLKLGLMQELIGRTQFFYGSLVFGNQGPDSGNSEILALHGTEEQKKRYLEPLLAGDVLSAFALTERDVAGADPTLIETTARRDGDGYVLNGRKWFISNASVADFFIVMAVVDPDASPHERASMFLVDAGTAGLDILRDIETIEHSGERYGHWENHAEVLLEDLRLPAEAMLGPEGAGFRLAQERLGPGRIHHCMRWVGQAQRAFDMICERAHTRFAHGALLKDHETIQTWIADSAAEIQAARLMTLHAAWVIDEKGPPDARVEIGMIKYFGAEVLHNVIDRAIQVHGSLGYSADLPLEYMYRFGRGARIYDGPDEVHRQSVARRILRQYGPAPGIFPSEHIPTRRQKAIEKYPQFAAVEG
ncbi:MAG TPA: acyl-CoA dehydrogenase family protein [Solirubrobacterales bacterium]|jgi:acyl-CoA dehydrogenase|nr:acyl-CoA dehydrogenase family protein [Solirubrobacterales bacterium]